MGTSPPGDQQWVEQLQQNLKKNVPEAQSAELQRTRIEIPEQTQKLSQVRSESSLLQQELDTACTEL